MALLSLKSLEKKQANSGFGRRRKGFIIPRQWNQVAGDIFIIVDWQSLTPRRMNEVTKNKINLFSGRLLFRGISRNFPFLLQTRAGKDENNNLLKPAVFIQVKHRYLGNQETHIQKHQHCDDRNDLTQIVFSETVHLICDFTNQEIDLLSLNFFNNNRKK
jgi:hypothetical protein